MADDEIPPKIGYKAPPIHSRFQPGQSGNKNGRPKQLAEFSDIVIEELFDDIKIKDGRRAQKVAKFKALVKQVMQSALRGDHKACMLLLRLIEITDTRRELTGRVTRQKTRNGNYFE